MPREPSGRPADCRLHVPGGSMHNSLFVIYPVEVASQRVPMLTRPESWPCLPPPSFSNHAPTSSPTYFSNCLPIHPTIHQPTHPSVPSSTHTSIQVLTHPPISIYLSIYQPTWASLVVQLVKNRLQCGRPGLGRPLEKGKSSVYSSILAWRILWTV